MCTETFAVLILRHRPCPPTEAAGGLVEEREGGGVMTSREARKLSVSFDRGSQALRAVRAEKE